MATTEPVTIPITLDTDTIARSSRAARSSINSVSNAARRASNLARANARLFRTLSRSIRRSARDITAASRGASSFERGTGRRGSLTTPTAQLPAARLPQPLSSRDVVALFQLQTGQGFDPNSDYFQRQRILEERRPDLSGSLLPMIVSTLAGIERSIAGFGSQLGGRGQRQPYWAGGANRSSGRLSSFNPASLPRFEHGGLLVGGRDAIVGEKGPEVVRFSRTARVVPNRSLSRASTPSGGVTVNVRGRFEGVSPSQVRTIMRSECNRVLEAVESGRPLSQAIAELEREEVVWA